MGGGELAVRTGSQNVIDPTGVGVFPVSDGGYEDMLTPTLNIASLQRQHLVQSSFCHFFLIGNFLIFR